MKNRQERIEELEEIFDGTNSYDRGQASLLGYSDAEWFYEVQRCISKKALAIIKDMQEEIKELNELLTNK